MIYKAEKIDTDKALAHIQDMIFDSTTKEFYEKEKIEKYYEGYREGLNVAKNMFYCSNYEK